MTSNTAKANFFKNSFFRDIIAGLVTAFPAIALGASFGNESGRGAFLGMLSAAIIPIIVSVLGGTRIQASGPTAPMTAVSTVMIASIYQGDYEHPEQIISLAILLTGLFLILAGIFRLGRFITSIPQVIIIGFMNGIALSIWAKQFANLTGVGAERSISGEIWQNLLFAAITFVGILAFPKILKLIKFPENIRPFLPGTLIIIVLVSLIFIFTGFNLETVSLNSNINSPLDIFSLPQNYIPKDVLNLESLQIALPFALELTILAYLDSLLTALVVDKNLKEKSNKNKELIAQGIANGVVSIFGGIPGAQATIRSVMLHKEGAKTRLAGVFVGIFVFLGIFVFKDLITLVANSIFAGVLFKTALDIFEQDYLIHFFKNQGWKKKNFLFQIGFVIYTTLVTLFLDLNIAVITGTAGFLIAKKIWKIEDASDVEETFSENEA